MIKLKNWKRIVAVTKYTLQRGYQYCNIPVIGIIGATAIKPYLDMYVELSLWQVIIIAMGIFIFVGFLDRIFNIMGEEQSYLTERNKTMMKGLYGKDNGRESAESNGA
jgi:hypothetical protein